MKLFLKLFFILLTKVALSQILPENVYINYNQRESVLQLNSKNNLANVKSIHFDNFNEASVLDELLEKLIDIDHLERIIISDFSDKKIPKQLAKLSQINTITIIHSPKTIGKNLFKELAQLPHLETLNLGNNDIKVIPKEISDLTRLNHLNISLNNQLDLENTIYHLSDCERLTRLDLPVNQIAELPKQISQLKKLKELNLTDNNITSLPIEMAEMDSLEKLYLTKNIVVNPVRELGKISALNIKILSIDEVSNAEIEELKKLFPKTNIIQEDKPTIDEIEHHLTNNKQENPAEEIVTLKKRNTEGIEVYSMAYRKYAGMFDKLNKPIHELDTTLFDERFMDTLYYNICRRQEGLDFDHFRIKKVSAKKKNQIWFTFDITTYFYNNFPENKAFANMIWVVVGNEWSKPRFKNEVLKETFSDYRMYYNTKEKNFNLKLKHASGFISLKVVPRFANKNSSISAVQNSYEMRYVKYLEELDKRRQQFNKSQYDKNISYKMKVNKIHNKSWKEFQKNYFSEKEKAMSEEEWLIYYDALLADEKSALENSIPSAGIIKRYLKLNGLKEIQFLEDLKKEQGTQIARFTFRDEQDLSAAIKEVYVINESLNHFKVYDGSNGLMEFYFFLRQSDDYKVVLMLRNGDVGVVDTINFKNVFFMQEESNLLIYKRFLRDYSTLADINSTLKL